MVDILQNHTQLDRPDHCPPLDPCRYQSVKLFPTGTSRRTSCPVECLFPLQLRGAAPSAGSELGGLHRHHRGRTRVVHRTGGERKHG